MAQELVDRPILITGVGRSGTSLLREIFRGHPAVFGIRQECRYLREFLVRFRTRVVRADHALDFLGSLPSFPLREFDVDGLRRAFGEQTMPRQALIQALCRDALSRHPDRTRLLLKDPDAVLALFEIGELLPNARVVICSRDPRAVLSSMKQFIPGRSRLSTVDVWNRAIAAANQCEREGFRTYRVRYEDLIDTPERIIREICDFVEISFDPVMMEFKQLPGVNAPDGVIRREPRQAWETSLAAEEIRFVERRCKAGMDQLGYSRRMLPVRYWSYLRLVGSERTRRIKRWIMHTLSLVNARFRSRARLRRARALP